MAGIVNLLAQVFTSAPMRQTSSITRAAGSSNPFARSSGNPFVSSNNSGFSATYGQNRPVVGGYFAGYYNNQPNIVGRRLFIEV